MGKLSDISTALDTSAKPPADQTMAEKITEACEAGHLDEAARSAGKDGVAEADAAGLGDPSSAMVDEGALRLYWNLTNGTATYRPAPPKTGRCMIAVNASFDSQSAAVAALKAMIDAVAKG